MDNTNMERAWEEITKRFKVDHPNAKAKIMAILNGRWKEWKHNLKSEFFVAGDRAAFMSNIACDSRVEPTQWAVLVDFWLSEDSQEKSNKPHHIAAVYIESHPRKDGSYLPGDASHVTNLKNKMHELST